ncbi:unnamed protein product, partial [Laminaria digitata]
DVTYNLKYTNFYKGDIQNEEEIWFTTAGSFAACGVYHELGQEYLMGLSKGEDEGSFTASSCGLYEDWSSVSREDKAAVE